MSSENLEAASLNDLSDDALRLIFSFLTLSNRLQLEGICKRWRHLLQESWKTVRHLKMADFQVEITAPFFNLMPQFYNNRDDSSQKFLIFERIATVLRRELISVESIDFRDTETPNPIHEAGKYKDEFLKILTAVGSSRLPCLRELNFYQVHLERESICCLKAFGELERLNIDEVFGRNFTSEEDERCENSIAETLESLKNLTEITISSLYGSGICLKSLSQTVKKARIFRSTTSGWGGEISMIKGFLLEPRLSLEELSLRRTRVLPDSADLMIFPDRTPNLTVLDLSYTTGFRNLKGIAHLKLLRALYMNCMYVSGDEPGTLFNEDDDTESPFLVYLSQSESQNSLEILHMNVFFPFCSDRDQNLEAIGRLGKLKELSLEHCKQLTPRKLDTITQGCPELERLLVHHALNLDDAGLATIGRQSWNLAYLDVTKCPKLSFAGLKALISGLETTGKRRVGAALEVYLGNSGILDSELTDLRAEIPWLILDNAANVQSPNTYDGPGTRTDIMPDPCLGLPVIDGMYLEDADSWLDSDEEFSDVADDIDYDGDEFYPAGHWGYDSFEGDDDFDGDEDELPQLL